MTEHDFPFFDDIVLPVGQRIALCLEYDGSAYSGWQLQSHCPNRTIQQVLENALAIVANASIRVHCAGRTDAGVHASGQIVHFDSPSERSIKAWVLGVNGQLPRDIAVKWAVPVDAQFHARFSATYRRYRYIIYNAVSRPGIFAGALSWEKMPLDEVVMNSDAQCLLGEQDFSGFRAAGCQSRTAMRCVQKISVYRQTELVIIDIQANAFLHHMVRNIAGSLLDVGAGRKPQGWTEHILLGKDRSKGSVTARPEGLYLIEVGYPREFKLPGSRPGPVFLGAGQ